MYIRSVGIIAVALGLAANVDAQQYYGDGYTIVSESTKRVGNDLDVVVYKNITAHNVEGGLRELLDGSGWKLAEYGNADPDIQRLYLQNYPNYKRTLNPIKLSDALEYIAGNAWDLVVDPVNKLVSFQLSKHYRCFTLKEASCLVAQ